MDQITINYQYVWGYRYVLMKKKKIKSCCCRSSKDRTRIPWLSAFRFVVWRWWWQWRWGEFQSRRHRRVWGLKASPSACTVCQDHSSLVCVHRASDLGRNLCKSPRSPETSTDCKVHTSSSTWCFPIVHNRYFIFIFYTVFPPFFYIVPFISSIGV